MTPSSSATEQRTYPSTAPRVGRTTLWIAALGTLLPIVCLAVPMYVIRPFRPQDPTQLAFALTIRNLAPWLSVVCALAVLLVVLLSWRKAARLWMRSLLITLGVLSVVAAILTRVNVFEIMFHPYPSPVFANAASSSIDPDDKVLAVAIHGEAHAYPIRTMGYHHIVNDTLGGVSIAVTYCTLCHTGLVWNRQLNGITLHFRLAGINNGNALIRDEETNSIWQQSTGQSIFGALKGQQLRLIHSDELTFALWRSEQPAGLVLKPEEQYASEYETKDWEKHIETTKTVIDTSRTSLGPHELMLGVAFDGQSKAYPVKLIASAKLIQDRIGDTSVVIVEGPDGASIRAFRIGDPANAMTFVAVRGSSGKEEKSVMRDAGTGSSWNFKGCAIDGKLAGQCLDPIDSNKDYWFDWMNHHPNTAVFKG